MPNTTPVHSVARGGAVWSAQLEAHCLYANWTAWPLYAFGHIWRQRRAGGYSASEVEGSVALARVARVSLVRTLSSLSLIAMSCLDVMYHQGYGAHYLPAAAYKATYYNHQQQQVRHTDFHNTHKVK